jgi:hypothetical protein
MNYMIMKVIVAIILISAISLFSTSFALAYNTPGPAGAPICTSEKPSKAWLYRVKTLGNGQYQLFWDKADRVTSWTIAFGVQPGKYIYGLANFGNDQSRNLIVNTFSNKTFYFVIKANNGCMPGDWSNEWKTGPIITSSSAVYQPPSTPADQTVLPVIPSPPPVKDISTDKITPVYGRTLNDVTTPVVSRTPAAGEEGDSTLPVATPTPAPGGFWNWLKGLFK